MKNILAIIEPQAVTELEDSGDNLEEYLGKLVEKAPSTAVLTTMANSNSEGLQGTSQTQMTALMEVMKDLHAKLGVTLELRIIKNDLIQNFDGIELEDRGEKARHSRLFKSFMMS